MGLIGELQGVFPAAPRRVLRDTGAVGSLRSWRLIEENVVFSFKFCARECPKMRNRAGNLVSGDVGRVVPQRWFPVAVSFRAEVSWDFGDGLRVTV